LGYAAMTNHFVSITIMGEQCSGCIWVRDHLEPQWKPNLATHKVEEFISSDDPDRIPSDSAFSPARYKRHPLTAYLCCEHFQMVFGRCFI